MTLLLISALALCAYLIAVVGFVFPLRNDLERKLNRKLPWAELKALRASGNAQARSIVRRANSIMVASVSIGLFSMFVLPWLL